MGEKDITQKILEDYDDVFADIVNVLLFKGEKRIKPEELKNANVHSMYKDDEGKLHEQERDVAKYWMDNNIRIALCGIENQSKVEKQMPLRIFGYEGASYRSQLGSKNIAPVITLVLYFGAIHWSAPKSIKELLNIPVGLESYVNDVRINVFEISWLTDEQIELFESDFKVISRFFANKRKNKNFVPDDPTIIKHVDEVLKLLSVISGDERYDKIENKSEVQTMCDVAQRLEDSGVKKGIKQGINQGIKQGINQGIKSTIRTFKKFDAGDDVIISSLIEDYGLSKEEAEEHLRNFQG